jgi:hypothetical protein
VQQLVPVVMHWIAWLHDKAVLCQTGLGIQFVLRLKCFIGAPLFAHLSEQSKKTFFRLSSKTVGRKIGLLMIFEFSSTPQKQTAEVSNRNEWSLRGNVRIKYPNHVALLR